MRRPSTILSLLIIGSLCVGIYLLIFNPAQHWRLLRSIHGPMSAVDSIATSADGSLIVTGSHDDAGNVRVWAAGTEPAQQIFTGTGLGPSVAISADGKHIAAGCNNLSLWSRTTQKLLVTLNGHQRRITRVCFSKDGTALISCCLDGTLCYWDLLTEECVSFPGLHKGSIVDIAHDPERKLLATASSDKTIRMWAYPEPGALFETFQGPVTAIRFIPYSSRLIAAAIKEKKHHKTTCDVTVFDTSKDPAEQHQFEYPHYIYSLAVSDDGKLFALGDAGGAIVVYDTTTYAVVRRFSLSRSLIFSLQFLPGSYTLVSGSGIGSEQGKLCYWDCTP